MFNEYCYRYRLWAAYNGNSPEKQRNVDKTNLPYFDWINKNRREFGRELLREEDQVNFDRFLERKVYDS